MKLEIDIKRKYALAVLCVVSLIFASGFAGAVWDTAKKFWHSADDVKLSVSGTDKSLQEAVNNDICLKSGTNCPSGSGSLESANCNIYDTGVANRGWFIIDLTKSGRNICQDGWGCTYRLWMYTSAKPAGSNFYTSSPVVFKQIAGGYWHDAKGDQTGTNGDGTAVKMTGEWYNNFGVWDDTPLASALGAYPAAYRNPPAETNPANQLILVDANDDRGFVYAICDF